MVTGVFRSTLLFPANSAPSFTAAELRSVIAHELAHIARRDTAVNLAQRIIESLFWFHPAVWLISAAVRREREHCCDAAAVRKCGSAKAMASALLRIEEMRMPHQFRLAVALTATNLSKRVRRLVNNVTTGRPVRAYYAIGGIILATVGMGIASAAVARRSMTLVSLSDIASSVNMTFNASDPAGHFTLDLAGGDVRAATIDGVPVLSDRLIHDDGVVTVWGSDGSVLLEVEVHPLGAIRWEAREPGAVGSY